MRAGCSAGVAINVAVVLANVALLAVSGWFITAMGLAGLGLMTLNYFTPAAAIRGLAVLRTLGRYVGAPRHPRGDLPAHRRPARVVLPAPGAAWPRRGCSTTAAATS